MNNKGFTVIEALIVVAVVGILLMVVISIARGVSSDDKSWCSMYKYSTINDVPVTCFEYLTTEKEESDAR